MCHIQMHNFFLILKKVYRQYGDLDLFYKAPKNTIIVNAYKSDFGLIRDICVSLINEAIKMRLLV